MPKSFLYIIHCMFTQEISDFVATNPIRERARGKPVVMVPLILYSDDLSGNRTKKWNCINAWSVLLAGLPKAVNAQLQNIHLLSASNKVSPIHLLEPIVEDLLVLQHGVDMYDALLCCEVVVYAPVLAGTLQNLDSGLDPGLDHGLKYGLTFFMISRIFK